jgi:hypothetical protein
VPWDTGTSTIPCSCPAGRNIIAAAARITVSPHQKGKSSWKSPQKLTNSSGLPPTNTLGVLTPRSFSAAAMTRSDVTPAACSSAMVGAISPQPVDARGLR